MSSIFDIADLFDYNLTYGSEKLPMKIIDKLKNFSDELTARELNLWAELLGDIIVALYYFPKAFRLIKKDEWAANSGAMIGLILGTIILAIIVSIVLGILVAILKKSVKKDERDYMFSARGSMIAYTALFVCVTLIIGLGIIAGFYHEITARLFLITGPLFMSHLLMLALMFSSTIKSVVQLFFYRRGY
jgi:hypothetical protein